MKRASFSAIVAASFVILPLGSGVVEEYAVRRPTDIEQHLATLVAHSDAGDASAEYRESVRFLREHAPAAADSVGGVLLGERGTFLKWHLTYLLGEFGDETGVTLLRELLDGPIPVPEGRPDLDSHGIDLQHAEEVAAHVQAVMSIGRIASLRPELRSDVIAALVDIGNQTPMLASSAIYELRKLLGAKAEDLRGLFGTEHAQEFERVLPPPRWQGVLAERMKQGDVARAEKGSICRVD
jgi:hypothetical protein